MARQRRDSASQILKRLEFDPLQVIVRQLHKMEKENPHSKELRDACFELMPFAHARLKQIDADIAVQGEVTLVIGGQNNNPSLGGSADDEN